MKTVFAYLAVGFVCFLPVYGVWAIVHDAHFCKENPYAKGCPDHDKISSPVAPPPAPAYEPNELRQRARAVYEAICTDVSAGYGDCTPPPGLDLLVPDSP